MERTNQEIPIECRIGSARKDLAELPVTTSEMTDIMQPILCCLGRMEMVLQDLSAKGGPPSTLLNDRGLKNVGCCHAQIGANWGTVKESEDHSLANQPRSVAESDAFKAEEVIANLTLNRVKSVSGFSESNKPAPPGTDYVSTHQIDEDDLKKGLDLIEQLEIRKAFQQLEHGMHGSDTCFDWLVKKVKQGADWWNAINEPQRKSALAQLINSSHFETSVRLAIVVNSVIVACSADWQIKHIGQSEPLAFSVLEYIFFTLFTIELVLRLLVHGCYFFVNEESRWNLLDFILVAISIADFTLGVLLGSASQNNVAFMRLLRFMKLARMLRSLRSFRFFKSLTVLLDSFRSSFISLFWGFVMLFFVLYMFALIFLQAFVSYLDANDVPPERVLAIKFKFGSIGQALLSLYMSVTGGADWGEYHELLMWTGSGYAFIFVFFTFFFLFAIFNILTGTLVEKAMSSSKPDRTDLILSQRKRDHAQKQEFIEICREMDQDNSGRISFEEFRKWLSNPIMNAYMEIMGIDIHDAELFFCTVGARQEHKGQLLKPGEVTIEQFVKGCLDMKGSASAITMQRQLFEMHILHRDLLQVKSELIRELQTLERLEILQLVGQLKKGTASPIADCLVNEGRFQL